MPIAQPNPRFTGYDEFGQGTPKVVPVTTGSTELLAANPDRLYAQLNNNSNQVMWVSLGEDAAVGRGQRMSPGAMLNFVDNELYLGAINAVTGTGTVNMDVIEGV